MWGWLASAASAPKSGPNLQQLIQETLAPCTGLALKDYLRVTMLWSSRQRSTHTWTHTQSDQPFGLHSHRRRWLNTRSLLGVEEVDHLIMLIHRLLCKRIPSETWNKKCWKQSQGTDGVWKKSCQFQKMRVACLKKAFKISIDPHRQLTPHN